MDLTALSTSVEWTHAVFVLFWLTYFTSIRSSSFTHVVACVRIFLMPLHVCLEHILLIYSPASGRVVCFHILATVNNVAMMRVYKYLFEIPLSILWDISTGMELLDHVVILFLIF